LDASAGSLLTAQPISHLIYVFIATSHLSSVFGATSHLNSIFVRPTNKLSYSSNGSLL